jgi:hypothetical protein
MKHTTDKLLASESAVAVLSGLVRPARDELHQGLAQTAEGLHCKRHEAVSARTIPSIEGSLVRASRHAAAPPSVFTATAQYVEAPGWMTEMSPTHCCPSRENSRSPRAPVGGREPSWLRVQHFETGLPPFAARGAQRPRFHLGVTHAARGGHGR